ncbi:DUF1513 domain-containing protein [Pontibacterium granulatum]|uniref:DUF1513 domain-containing protein n=1 Tax=Pontibacterium granulatum TaxID=2036029 RepID=UPI00249C0CD2|nr:DUF1513 domain-containing protein [Pontibacterium granulatum]MDI3324213.1 DUF1513 domain-containing protein [Pontibacterium granulatum]
MTGINRRQFSLLLAGSWVTPTLLAQTGSTGRSPLFASAATGRDGLHHLQMVAQDGSVMLDHTLPQRAHHVALHPTQPWLAAVARRPGRFIDVVDYNTGTLIRQVEPDTERHFYGHAIFSPDGQYLISCENNVADGQGRITVRDIQLGFSKVADHPSYGIGPHELALMADTKTLVVANGGILTHPDKGRDKLNLDSMQPSLAYIDLHSGELLEQVQPPAPLHQLSIRHLDVNAAGKVVIALQYQGAKYDDVPLVAMHQRGEPLQLLHAPDHVNRAMKQYCGSARFDASGRYAAISSPRGDLVTFWDSRDNQYLGQCKTRDGCGLAATLLPGEFLISTGSGHLYHFDMASQKRQRIKLDANLSVAWDNHMTLV